MDKLYIRDLSIDCVIGTKPEERRGKQTIVINIVLECDRLRACLTDNIDDTVNYNELKKRIIDMAEASRYLLLERMAEAIAQLCLGDRLVAAATVTVDKPGALAEARSAAIEIRRERRKTGPRQ